MGKERASPGCRPLWEMIRQLARVRGTFSVPRSQAAFEDGASADADRADWPSARIYICS